MKPKGKLLLIGGAEDKGNHPPDIANKNIYFQRFEILTELIKISKNQRIEVITTGSKFQEEVKDVYLQVFDKLGYSEVGFIPIEDKNDAKSKIYLSKIDKASTIFFTGGDQFRLSTILSGTKIIDQIREKYHYDENFLIAGTSAGAMVLSDIMIISGGLEEALIDSDLQTAAGLRFLRNCIIDTHFIKRERFGRLAHAIILYQEHLGIGLGEDTALIITDGTEAECRGSGMVIVIEGKYIGQTNISKVKKGEPIFVENLKIHMLVKNCRFSLKTRKLYNPAQVKTNIEIHGEKHE